jgi:hypothetical protein
MILGHIWNAEAVRSRRFLSGPGIGRQSLSRPCLSRRASSAAYSRYRRSAPPARFEPALTAPETVDRECYYLAR